jgi:hypothetical protein
MLAVLPITFGPSYHVYMVPPPAVIVADSPTQMVVPGVIVADNSVDAEIVRE